MPFRSSLSEFAIIGDALTQAAAAVEDRARERERTLEQRRLLINELNHRVKNTLAVVQSIAVQSLGRATALVGARDALTNRLGALAQAHDVLTRENWEGAELREVARVAVAPLGSDEQISIGGPQVRLTPALSVSLALALHELGTNALKYGALSRSGGHVDIAWEVVEKGDARRLSLRWAESGGPPVQHPTREGFGTRLVRRSLEAELDASVSLDFAPDGVVCVMTVSLPPIPAAKPPISSQGKIA